jgi:hypothetical protein
MSEIPEVTQDIPIFQEEIPDVAQDIPIFQEELSFMELVTSKTGDSV